MKNILKGIGFIVIFIVVYEILGVVVGLLIPAIISFFTNHAVLAGILHFLNWIVGGLAVVIASAIYTAWGMLAGAIPNKVIPSAPNWSKYVCLVFVAVMLIVTVIDIFRLHTGYVTIWYDLWLLGAVYVGLEIK